MDYNNLKKNHKSLDKSEEVSKPVEKKEILGTVNCNKLYLRKGPSTNSKDIAVLDRNTILTILEDGKKSNGFYKVKNDSLEGYVMAEFISLGE